MGKEKGQAAVKEVVPPAEQKIPLPGETLSPSFRDPAGTLVHVDGHILRILTEGGEKDATAFLNSLTASGLVEKGKVIASRVLSTSQTAEWLGHDKLRALFQQLNGKIIVEHERVWFPSFPYEWPSEMLYSAGNLTLDLAEGLLDEALGLKDATPYNILFRGAEPVFIDLPSFEKRHPGDPTWLAYAQFVRTFLLPLLAFKYFRMPIGVTLTTRRDGLEPDEVYPWLNPWRRLMPPFLSLVSLPHWLGAKKNPDETKLYDQRVFKDTDKARFILRSLFGRLRRSLRSLEPSVVNASAWLHYTDCDNNYTQEQISAKTRFVKEVLAELRPKKVLDIGCNTGHFSALAATNGVEVVSIDSDPVVAGRVWRKAKADNLNILPLVVNLTRPTPGIGWRNEECASFLDRARGAFDAVLMLAMIHHMIVSERIPLDEIINLAAELTRDTLIIEFVGPGDSMFRRLTRGRDDLHKDFTPQVFEASVRRHFQIVRQHNAEGSSRHLYWLRLKN